MGAASLTLDDIQFRHSGGLTNVDPSADLGGEMSIFPLDTPPLNNLFNSLSAEQSREGIEDYRCFYVINVNHTDSLRNVKLWLEQSDKYGGSVIALGINLVQEKQQVAIMEDSPGAFPNEGNFLELQVPSYTPNFKVYYDPNITKWEGNFQTEIRSVKGLEQVRVTATGEVPNVTFTVDFGGHDDYATKGQSRSRSIEDIVVVDDSMDNVSASVFELVDGSPINTDAPIIANATTPPPGIEFDFPLRGNPKELGNLNPFDYFPVWVRRTVPAGTLAKLTDDFTIRIEGTYP